MWASSSRSQLSSSSIGCRGGAIAQIPVDETGDCRVCVAEGESNDEVGALVVVDKSMLLVDVLLRERPGSGGGKVYQEKMKSPLRNLT